VRNPSCFPISTSLLFSSYFRFLFCDRLTYISPSKLFVVDFLQLISLVPSRRKTSIFDFHSFPSLTKQRRSSQVLDPF